jgi:hypothetical protein
MFVPLLVQTTFAAVGAAIIVNIRWPASRRARRALLLLAVTMPLTVAAWLGLSAFQQHTQSGAQTEERIAYKAIIDGNFDTAKQHLLKASNYWWWKGWWDGAGRDRQQSSDEEWMRRQFREASAQAAQNNENRARDLLQSCWSNVFCRLEAQELLATAAEKWRAAGNTAAENRVRAWGKNINTEVDLQASLPNHPATQDTSTDPNAWLRDAESQRQWESEEGQCRQPFPYPPHKWTHMTQFGKTFAIVKFRERKAGDRNKELDGYAKAISAKSYKQWSRVRQGGADWVEIVFYK